ncbi:Fe-S oxidoreductase [Lachnoclostridium sp. An14]|uniref:TIGR03936 family radical SAM-associated protein n=1 Tax=Lachnoclostridium sp. An14 TaxID=1965562 RepID=UPI000B3AB9F5|nr:TIGR03936 family radical SAM-associated protein [Lachnoclostridium sp. An14]OUQ21812.1 Fe-S oxidoreductase [Lachnoclostridium sp. An14]
MKIRIKFAKHGTMKFIGHLDVMRYFQKAMRRADVNIRYSEGFSPHQIMSFAAPLGVGLTSNGEYMDIEVHSTGSSAEMVRRLNEVMVEGFEVLSYRRLPDGAGNAMSLVDCADYTVRFRNGYEPEDLEGFFAGLEAFYGRESIPIVKKTKKGERQLDLKPLIYQLQVLREDERPAVAMRVSTGSTDNIKPELVLETYCREIGMEITPLTFEVQREEIYAPDFVPLEALGEDIE